MDWDNLRFALAVARNRSLTAAAAELGVTHSTVGRRLAALEAEAGVRVFDRHPEGYVATAAGEQLLAIASAMQEQVHQLDRSVLGHDARLRGPLCVATVDLRAVHQMDVFASFTERYPEVQLQITAGHVFHNLGRREADVALRATNRPQPTLVGRKLGRLEYALYGARALVERVGRDAPFDDYPWVLWSDRLDARLTEERKHAHAPRGRVACRVDNASVFHAAVTGGVGIGFMPFLDASREEGLVQLRPMEPDFGMDLWLLTHPDLRHAARVRAFMDHVVERFSALGDAMRCGPAA